jgi:hypothetical protein
MNEAENLMKKNIKKDKSAVFANILDSVNKGQNLLNTNNSTEQLIAKYNISSAMADNQILRILKNEAVNNILLRLINSGKIEEKNGLYYYGGKKFTETDIKKSIFDTYKEEEIKNMMISEFNKVKIIIQKQSNTKKIEENNQIKIVKQNNIMKLRNDLKEQEKIKNEKTQERLDSLYKLNKIQANQRKERAQIEFNKNQQIFQQDMLRAKDNKLILAYQGLQIDINDQKIKINNAKKADDRHIQDLKQKYLDNLNKQRQHEESEKLRIEHHNQLIRLQQDIANKANENFKNLINGAKENNDALIRANNINNQEIINANAKQVKGIIDDQNKGKGAIVKGLLDIGNQIKGLGKNINGIEDDFIKMNENINNANKKLLEPPLGIPPACNGKTIPTECSGTGWRQVPVYTNATNRKTRKTNVQIYRCNGGGNNPEGGSHWCSSDGNGGTMDELPYLYEVNRK